MSGERRRTILIVEDEPGPADVMNRIAKKAGFETIVASTGTDALRSVNAKIDLIVCDVNLGDIPGPELVERLREQGVTCPVIFTTGDFSVGTLDKTLATSEAVFLPKPFSQDELTQAIWSALRLR